MQIDFSPVRSALRRCRAEGYMPQIWWRDDDAIAPTSALDRLLELAERTEVPVHLAIIPKHVDAALPSHIAGAKAVPLVHGWAHENHSPPDAKKAEFGQMRPDALDDLSSALSRMHDLFDGLVPMFVPPWNRIAPELVLALPGLGYRAVSTFLDRKSAHAATGLAQINTHIDPIFWKGTRGLVEPETLVAQTADRMMERLSGNADRTEPIGLLTHHLVHTADIWTFSELWLTEMRAGGAAVASHLLEA